MNRREIGKIGELIARDFLVQNHFQILAENYRTRNGEIDLIAMEKQCIVFIEVKARHGKTHGYPREAVDQKKQDTIKAMALSYLREHPLCFEHMRFDVIEIFLREDDTAISTLLLRNAF